MRLDPAVQMLLRAALSVVFARAAAHKLADVDAFRRAVEGYRLLEPLWAVPVGAALIAAEIAVAVGLWLPRVAPLAAVGGAALLALYGAAMAINLARGRRDFDCGCSGPAQRQPIRAALVVRNALLAGVALISALPASARPLGWLDAYTIAAGAVGLILCWLAADALLAEATHSAALRRPRIEVAGA
ncbi:MAG: MauE/DoxX family redox-associated membrane protein [bacterium]